LLPFWDQSVERCGVISSSHEIIEVTNQAKDPTKNFKFLESDLEDAITTWHSHPTGSANLSIDDYWFFQSWTSLGHFIIFDGEVRFYQTVQGRVYQVDEEDDHPAWLPEGTS
jgi:proteasome lid subunit RPN8/RPN11